MAIALAIFQILNILLLSNYMQSIQDSLGARV